MFSSVKAGRGGGRGGGEDLDTVSSSAHVSISSSSMIDRGGFV